MEEKVLTALRTLGFMPEKIEEFGYRFEYEGLTLLYPTNEDDTQCMTLIMPNIFDITEENRLQVTEAIVRLTGRIKYVQPQIMFDNQVWINYHHYLGEQEVTDDLLEHMVRVLDYATLTFHQIINGEDNES